MTTLTPIHPGEVLIEDFIEPLGELGPTKSV